MKLAVFDWNGTLLDDTGACLRAANDVLHFFDAAPIDMNRLQATFSFPLIHFYVRNTVPADLYLAHAKQAGEIFLTSYEREAAYAGLRAGAEPLLARLADMKITPIILSNHLHRCLVPKIEALGIAHFFEHISGNQDYGTITQSMNKQARLQDILQNLSIMPEEAFIIGDSDEEPHLADNMGMYCISITGGIVSRARLKDCGGDFLIDGLDEVIPLLESGLVKI